MEKIVSKLRELDDLNRTLRQKQEQLKASMSSAEISRRKMQPSESPREDDVGALETENEEGGRNGAAKDKTQDRELMLTLSKVTEEESSYLHRHVVPINASLEKILDERTATLRSLRRQRVRDLFAIYPIDIGRGPDGTQRIRGLRFWRLVDGDNKRTNTGDGVVWERRRQQGAAAYGHAVKLMLLLGEYLHVRLRHEMHFCGSRSTITSQKVPLVPSQSLAFTRAVVMLRETAIHLAAHALDVLGVPARTIDRVLAIENPSRILTSLCAIQDFVCHDERSVGHDLPRHSIDEDDEDDNEDDDRREWIVI